ncbi:MAG: 3-methyladenine DNA glycosylase [Brachybacterium sp.]|nr:3-methyladenine DNA glycosylase [Brachybacterium sp.]
MTPTLHPVSTTRPTRVFDADAARVARVDHERRADALTAARRARVTRGETDAVEDFLFTYYPFSPARLRRWHPGWRTAYDPAADVSDKDRPMSGDISPDGDSRTWYLDGPDGRRADVARFLRERGDALGFMVRLLQASSMPRRTPNFGCFGLHEWAMVYRLGADEQRHEALPLRLSREETDAVVEQERLVCSHVDAFRFFTPAARPRNAVEPTRQTQIQRDNPACLHVGMDLYKWAMKLVPLVPSALVLDCFEHARETRVLDMEASPYDVRGLGYGAVPIETTEGKAEYVRRQRTLAGQADELRHRILTEVADLVPESA